MADNLLQYGARLRAEKLKETLRHMFLRNDEVNKQGKRGTPVCIWGTHGLGKTQIVTDFAHENEWELAYCAPAQFEEMGDLHGLPEIVDPDPNKPGDEYTIFRPPEWVPKKKGPGILLLDDMNRADDRILRGLMQLLQNFYLFSWQMPEKWQIVATANPEGGDYSLTPMDDAMLTRMLHVTLIFDPKSWATWASQTGVDPRGISFVLTYPEAVTGKRTTPRTLTQFFEQIQDIKDLKGNLEMVETLALSALDDVTAASFISFINDDLKQLVEPGDILNTQDFKDVEKRIKELAGGSGENIRVDRLAAMCTRLYLELINPGYKPGARHKENLITFMLMKVLPNDLRVSLSMDLTKQAPETVKEMLRDKRVATLMLQGM